MPYSLRENRTMNAGLNFQPVDDEGSRETAPMPRPDPLVTEQELDALRYTGVLKSAPRRPDPNGSEGACSGGRGG